MNVRQRTKSTSKSDYVRTICIPYRIESRVVFVASGDVTRGRMMISENCFFGGNGGGSVCKVASGRGGGSGTISLSPYESLS